MRRRWFGCRPEKMLTLDSRSTACSIGIEVPTIGTVGGGGSAGAPPAATPPGATALTDGSCSRNSSSSSSESSAGFSSLTTAL
jgi:hypothetical protein